MNVEPIYYRILFRYFCPSLFFSYVTKGEENNNKHSVHRTTRHNKLSLFLSVHRRRCRRRRNGAMWKKMMCIKKTRPTELRAIKFICLRSIVTRKPTVNYFTRWILPAYFPASHLGEFLYSVRSFIRRSVRQSGSQRAILINCHCHPPYNFCVIPLF